MADFSLALINRTGAYHISRDLLANLPEFFAATRYWRITAKRQPTGAVGWLLGKAMLKELSRAGAGSMLGRDIRRPGNLPMVFLDPLYVLRSEVRPDDIILCHDLGPVTNPDLFDPVAQTMYRRAYRRIMEARPTVVFVSDASRRAFIAHFGECYRSLAVIPLYVRPGMEATAEGKPVPGVRAPFLLTVGALETRKNYPRAVEAFRKSGLAQRGYSYVCCGPRGNAAAEVERLLGTTPSVRFLGFRSDAELRWLYRNAHGLVLPSLLEGFGIPALEAARHRLPALVSAGGAQEEAIDGGAILVDPQSVDSIAEGMVRIVDMPDTERGAMLDRATRRAEELTLDLFVARWRTLLETASRTA